MLGTGTRIAGRERLWRIALALLPGLALVLLRGVDANWDLRNYHLYNPHAWLTGRMLLDVAPAQLQTWHNPLLDLPLYLLATSGLDMRWTSAWLTLPFALAIYLLLGLQRRLAPEPPTRGEQFALALLALSGAAAWSTIGNSMNDGFVAAALLGALALVLRPAAGPREWLLAGLLAGAVAGLKQTAGLYCIALAVAVWASGGGWRERLWRCAALAAGGLAGFLLTYAAWGYTLYRMTGNPVFPYFNQVFGSAWLPAASYEDLRFRVDGLAGVLAAPFELLTRTQAFSELTLRDPRLAVLLLSAPALAWWSARRGDAERARALRILGVFAWVAFIVWALQFGIYRYAATLELLGALALLLVVQSLPRQRGARAAVLGLAFVAASVATVRPDWGHTRYTTPRFGIPAWPVGDDALVVIAGAEPVAYLALGAPRQVPVVALSNSILSPTQCSGLQARARQRVDAHRGPLWLLAEDAAAMARARDLLAANYPLDVAGQCWSLPSALGEARLCPLRRRAPIPPCG